MKQNQDIFVQMKKEDRSFGEKSKAPRRMTNHKANKHRMDFKRFSTEDFKNMEDDFYEMD